MHLAWLVDEAIWQPLPEQAWDDLCTYWMADPDRMEFPDLVWEPCGEGCARADVLQGYGEVAATAIISMSAADGAQSPYLHLNNARLFANGYSVQVQRSLDLRTGKTAAAVLQLSRMVGEYASCGSSNNVGSGLESVSSRNRGELPSVAIKGTWDLEHRAWIWQLPWVTTEERGFGGGYCEVVGMEAGGRSFYLCPNVIRAALTPGSSAISILDRPGDDSFSAGKGAALGDLVVWSERDRSQPGSRVRGWKPDGSGVRTLLADIPVDTCAVGLSDTHVAGFSTAGGCGFNPEGRFWIAKRAEDGTLADFRLGPIFWPEPVAEPTPVKVWGDHIAIVWGEQFYESRADRRRLLVARASDWAMRDLRGPAGHEVWEAGLTDEHLYVVFAKATGGVGYFSHVYRYELAKFEHIGQPIVPVPDPALP